MDVQRIEKSINELINKLSEIRPSVFSFATCVKDVTQRLYQMLNYSEANGRVSKNSLASKNINNITSNLMLANKMLADFSATYNSVLKRTQTLVGVYEDHLSRARSEYGGVGFDFSLLSEHEEIIKNNCFTDDGFVALIASIKKEDDVFNRMDMIVDALRESVEITNGLRRKHEKMNERKRLGGGSSGEAAAVISLRKRIIASEEIHRNRVGKLLEAYGNCRKKILGFLDGSSEAISSIVRESKLTNVAKENLDDISFRLSQITKNDNNAKGTK